MVVPQRKSLPYNQLLADKLQLVSGFAGNRELTVVICLNGVIELLRLNSAFDL